MRLHFKFKGGAVFLRDSGFVQQKNPADSLKRHAFCKKTQKSRHFKLLLILALAFNPVKVLV